MNSTVVFDPLLPHARPLGRGRPWRSLFVAHRALARPVRLVAARRFALTALLAALANPSLQTEDREPLTDIVIAVIDESASQRISDRADQTAAALAAIESRDRGAAATPNSASSAWAMPTGDGGTLLMTALSEALAEEPRARIAGAILVTDGRCTTSSARPTCPRPSTPS